MMIVVLLIVVAYFICKLSIVFAITCRKTGFRGPDIKEENKFL